MVLPAGERSRPENGERDGMEKELHYELVKSRKRKKTISLEVRRNGAVVVQAPQRTSRREIEGFIKAKERWLKERLREQRERERECAEKTFAAGETFLFLGEAYPLAVPDARSRNGQEPPLSFTGSRFILRSGCAAEGKILFTAWYKERARDLIARRLRYFCPRLWCFPRSVHLSNARCRWGSCTADDRIYLSWRIVMAPPAVVDYVILHELLHMKEKNHSRRFWNLLEAVLPDYRTQRAWLRQKGHFLDL